jgi:outer membrane receptor protein involved in Fe transport
MTPRLLRAEDSVEQNSSPVASATPKQAPQVDVIVQGTNPLSRDATGDTTGVSGQTLRESSRGSTLDALSQQSADIYVTAGGVLHGVSNGATGGVQIRGLGGSPNSQVLVVEDGVPDYQGIFGHPIADAYAPALIDQALVIKGGDSVLYGTNAMGGVIALSRRWRTTDGTELTNDSAYGSYTTLRESLTLLEHRGRTDMSAALQTTSTDGHRAGAGGSIVVGQAAIRYHLTPHLTLALRDKLVQLHGADPGPASHPLLDHWYDVRRNDSSLQLDWTKRQHRLTVTPYANIGQHQLYDGFLSTDCTTGTLVDFETRLHEQATVALGGASNQVGGKIQDRIAGTETPISTVSDVAVYEQMTWKPFPSVTAVAGSRELYSTKYGSVFLYKAGLRWQLFPKLYAHARVTRNFRQPTLRELYLPYPTANPNLKPEQSLNADAGLEYVSDHLTASVTAYRTAATNMIRYFGVWPAAEVVNVDHIVIPGIEGRVGIKRIGPATLWITGNRQDVGRYTRQNPNAKANATLEVEKEIGLDSVGGAISAEWVHGLYMADYGRQPIADVFVVDATLRYRYFAPERRLSLEPYLYLRNILDRRYAYVADYPMPGFNVLCGLKIGL